MCFTRATHAAKKTTGKTLSVIPYKKDPHLGEEYLKNEEEEREAAKEAQRQAKKKGKSASASTAEPLSEPPPSNPHLKWPSPSGYVPSRQSPLSAEKF